MTEQVTRTMARPSFRDQKNTASYNYPVVQQPQQTQRSALQPPSEPQNVPYSQPQTPYYQPSDRPTTMPGYSRLPPPYTSQPPSYQAPLRVGAPYTAPYPPPQSGY